MLLLEKSPRTRKHLFVQLPSRFIPPSLPLHTKFDRSHMHQRASSLPLSQMPLSGASVLHASSLALLLLLLLLGATASAAAHGDMSTAAGNATVAPRGKTEMYICYLCVQRNPLLIRYCPIYWDECHLICFRSAAATAAAAIAAEPGPAPPPGSSAVPREEVNGDDCYVMKLYQNGSYVIVSHQDCSGVARCLLTCGGGDVAADRKALAGAAATGPTTTTAVQGFLPQQRVADFQRCGTQLKAPSPAPRAVHGGVHRATDGASSAPMDERVPRVRD
ncbi:hypothetical protein ACP70R_013781 [Stipagrostis hirtigluma subsp. patula]